MALCQVLKVIGQKDFTSAALAPLHLESIHPDDFIINQADLSEASVILATQRIRGRLNKPEMSPTEYLAKLRSNELPKTAEWLSQYAKII